MSCFDETSVALLSNKDKPVERYVKSEAHSGVILYVIT